MPSRRPSPTPDPAADLRLRVASCARRAELALQVGRVADAVRHCREGLEVDPGHTGALEVLARALWRAGEHEELAKVLRRLTLQNPYEPGYRTMMGQALECLGRYGEAIEAYRKAATPEALAAADALLEWQGGLVAGLLGSDPVFRAHFSQNAHEACIARGFTPGERTEAWVAEAPSRATFSRPC